MLKHRNLNFIASFCLLLAGCGLFGPEYRKPQVASSNNWRSQHSVNQVSSAENLPQLAWWKKFNDPVLNDLIKQGLYRNNNLGVAKNNLLVAQATLKQVEMNWVPTISLGAAAGIGQSFNNSFTNTSGNPALGMLQPNNPQGFGFSSVGLIPNYTLNIFSQINQQKMAKLNIEMQEQVINSVKLAIISQIAGSYFTLLGLHQQLNIQHKMIADAEKIKYYNLIKYQSGSIDNLQIAALEQYIANLKAQLPQIQHNIVEVENAIQVLTDHNPQSIAKIRNFDTISADGIIPVNLPSQVLNNRPDIAIAEYQLKLTNANIGLVRSQFFPAISLTTPLGAASGSLNKLFRGSTNFWDAQVAAGMPLLNLGLVAEMDKSKAQKSVAYYQYVQAVRTGFADVDTSLSQHDSLYHTMLEQQASLKQAQAIQHNLQLKHQLGALSYADTLNAQLDVDQVLASKNQTKIQQLQSMVKVYQALGGGYGASSD